MGFCSFMVYRWTLGVCTRGSGTVWETTPEQERVRRPNLESTSWNTAEGDSGRTTEENPL